jgi:hypothetical protein
MTESLRAPLVSCLSCGTSFAPRKAGHVFCSTGCRHRGEREAHERVAVDHEAVATLFDESRDPDERCRGDDWYLDGHPDHWRRLDSYDTVAGRRRWYLALRADGRL